MLWLYHSAAEPDTHAAFRGVVELEHDSKIVLHTLGASTYVLWLDGEYVQEGPARFPQQYPQYSSVIRRVSKGRHNIAVQVHYDGVETRILRDIPPFIDVKVICEGRELPVHWKCLRLSGYLPQVRRLSQSFGWIEWCDTRSNPDGWQHPDFDDSGWLLPVEVERGLGKPAPLDTGEVKRVEHSLTPCAGGLLAERFGYERDDIPTRFFLRELDCDSLPPDGVWQRYDLGRVRLGRPRFVLNLPAGAVVEFAYCEWLAHGRVSPYMPLTGGLSCYIDHMVARGGRQEFSPFDPRGGRFLEIHVLAPPGEVEFVEEAYMERCYWERTEGAFTCDNEQLNRIWDAGARTLRACAEDAILDCPTRERGQWTGDSLSVGLFIGAYAFSDLRLFRRVLIQSAQCARDDGIVAAACPGHTFYMPVYSLIWVNAALHYHEMTGERSLLDNLHDAAVKNMEALNHSTSAEGLLITEDTEFLFVDWGYERNSGPCDMATNLFYLSALRGMVEWGERLGRTECDSYYAGREVKTRRAVRSWLDTLLHRSNPDWDSVGFHRAVLALSVGILDKNEIPQAISHIKSHIMQCFPNNPSAPRNDYPNKISTQFITPYFSHWALSTLIEHGETEFVLGQYQKCWGYLLEDGRTTLLEVFDPRWSHCHHWSGSPTWQLSRYGLGLRPRYDLGLNTYMLDLHPGCLQHAKGSVPLREGGVLEVSWKRTLDAILYQITSPAPITLRVSSVGSQAIDIPVHGMRTFTLRPGGRLK